MRIKDTIWWMVLKKVMRWLWEGERDILHIRLKLELLLASFLQKCYPFFHTHILLLLSPSHAFIPFIPSLDFQPWLSQFTPIFFFSMPLSLSSFHSLEIESSYLSLQFSSTLFWVYANLCFLWLQPVLPKCFTTPVMLVAKKFKLPLLKLSSWELFTLLLCKEVVLLTFDSLQRLLSLNSLLKITLFSPPWVQLLPFSLFFFSSFKRS